MFIARGGEARRLFVESQRANLPQVPACQDCNGGKSKLEHYLATVLPFDGVHADAVEMLQDRVARRLAKNEKLHRELVAGAREDWIVTDQGQKEKRLTVPVDGEKLEELFALVVRGLVRRLRWHIRLRLVATACNTES